MSFVRDLGVKVTVLHEGSVLAEGSLDHVSADPRVVEVYLGRSMGSDACSLRTVETAAMSRANLARHLSGATHRRSTSTTAPPRRCAACRSPPKPGKVTCVLGRNGVGKTSLLRAIVGQQPISGGAHPLRGRSRSTGSPPYPRARAGIGYVPQGREIFPLLTVKENLETGYRAAAAQRAQRPGRGLRALPGPEGHARAARRRPLRRPAAAARHRPRAGHAAEAPRARRADRGHPALDHQGHRPRDRLPEGEGRPRHRAGRAVSRLRPRACRQRGDHGSRRDRLLRDARRISTTMPFAVISRSEARRASAGASAPASERRRGAVTFKAVARRDQARPALPVGSAKVAAAQVPGGRAGRSGADQHRRRAHRRRRACARDVELGEEAARRRHHPGPREDLPLRSAGTAEVDDAADRRRGARLDWLPQETILFDGAPLPAACARRPRRRCAALLVVEAVIFGRRRAARGALRRVPRPLAHPPRRRAALCRRSALRLAGSPGC